MPALLLVAASLASYVGFACLALAMPHHWTQVSGQATDVAPHRRWLRPCAYLLLSVAYALCVYRDGSGFGSLLWTILISAAAIAVALTLTWQPRLLLPTAWRFRPGGGKGC
ncbi:MAG TPA: DUF3325 domain-containing protein [Noviherbaspirillum sp.]|nr:DUF3325 domain-containing protein [Noviherbaspirillum sp.]